MTLSYKDFYKVYLEVRRLIAGEIEFIGIPYLQEQILEVLHGENLFLIIGSDASVIFLTDKHLIEFVVGKTDMEKNMEVVFKNSLIVINMKSILRKTGLNFELSDEKFTSIFRILAEKNNEHNEINIHKTNGEIKKVKTTIHRKFEKGESLSNLIKKPNQRTTIFSNNNGDLGIQIEKEIK